MRIVIGSLFFILAVFPHYIELVTPPASPQRTHAHIDTSGSPSSSGRSSTTDVVIYGSIWPSRHASVPRSFTAPESSGLRRDQNYHSSTPMVGLFCDINGHRVPLGGGGVNIAGYTKRGWLLGVINNGILRPVYNIHGQIVMVRIADRHEFVMTMEEAEENVGMNQPIDPTHLHHQ